MEAVILQLVCARKQDLDLQSVNVQRVTLAVAWLETVLKLTIASCGPKAVVMPTQNAPKLGPVSIIAHAIKDTKVMARSAQKLTVAWMDRMAAMKMQSVPRLAQEQMNANASNSTLAMVRRLSALRFLTASKITEAAIAMLRANTPA